MPYTTNFKETMYSHYIQLFHETDCFKTRSNARRMTNFYGRALGFTEAVLREDKKPILNFKKLISLIGDGEE